MTNKFADALKSAPRNPPSRSVLPAALATAAAVSSTSAATSPPAVSKRLRQMAFEEDTTVQDLLAEALELLFQSRGA